MQVERSKNEIEAIDRIEHTAGAARALVDAEGIKVVARAERATGQTLAMADILKCSTFYDRDTIEGVRAYHAEQGAVVGSLARRAKDRAANVLAAATAVFLRLVQSVYTPAVVQAARRAALEHRPAFAAAEAGMNAAGEVLARAVEQVPSRPTVTKADV